MAIRKTAGKIDRRVVRTRKAIMAAFDKLLADRGMDKITVSAIAREADIDRKTFYLHYTSVEDLANHKTEAGIEQVLADARRHSPDLPLAERIHLVLCEINRILLDDLKVCSRIASSLSTDQILGRIERASTSTLAHAGVKGDLTALLDAQVLMTLRFYIAGALSLYVEWLKSDHSQPIEMVSDAVEKALGQPFGGDEHALDPLVEALEANLPASA